MTIARTLATLAVLVVAPLAHAGSLDLKLRNAEGQEVLNKILDDDGYWSDAYVKTYSGKQYDEIRLKSIDSGYVPMITGEGGQDFEHDVVADVVYMQNTRLPKYMDGAKIVMDLGRGYDESVGAEYRDTFYVLDLSLFYATFPQRMYRKHDPATNRTVLWFEKMEPSWVPASTWTDYQAKMTKAVEGMETRWIGGSIVPVGDIYGMFVVEPGSTQTSRVSFVSKLAFGDDAGFIAKMGSQMAPVLKAGLKSGFTASVNIATHEQARREKRRAAAEEAKKEEEAQAPAPAP
jgi:hypothetical protein